MMHTLTHGECEAAWRDWGANCGPAALAACLGVPIANVRSHLKGFEGMGYTNPTMMFGALRSLGVKWQRMKTPAWPVRGLVRIQWHGPWMKAGG